MRTDMDALMQSQASLKAQCSDLKDYIDNQLPKQFKEDRKRIYALEHNSSGKPTRTDVNKEHLNLLASTLLTKAKTGQRGITYSEAADILHVGKSSICKLRNLIAADPRFNISWHPNRPNMKVITLKRFSDVNN